MKRFLLLLAVMTLSVSIAQAYSFRISPDLASGPVEAELGDTVSYTVYFETSAEWDVAGYELLIAYDASELAFLDPGYQTVPPFGLNPIPGSFMDAKWDASNPGYVRLYALLFESYIVLPPGEVEMFTLDFEVINLQAPDGLSDCELLPSLSEDPYGVAFLTYYDRVFEFNGAQGADVGIPEPTSMALLGVGLAGVLLRKKS